MEDVSAVSVIIPIYNEAAYIERCVNSLVRQTFPVERIEWLFIDGMSSDDTIEKLMVFSSSLNLKILKNEKLWLRHYVCILLMIVILLANIVLLERENIMVTVP